MASNFRAVLGLLEKYFVSVRFGTCCQLIHSLLTITALGQTRYFLDPLLGPRVGNFTSLIRSRAVVLYFQPLETIRLERMSTVFGWTVEDTEREVVSLIQRGDIHGRVDSQNKSLRARATDHRAQLYAHALKAGADMQSATNKLLLRLQLYVCSFFFDSLSTLLLIAVSDFRFCSQQANLIVCKAQPPPAPAAAGASESAEQ